MRLQTNNIWLTSDTHYSHSNICRGTSNWGTFDSIGEFHVNEKSTRNFEELETMNDAIVNNINENVDANDWLIHLGDWSFGGIEKVTEFREKINCKNIVLMIGNHDKHIQDESTKLKKLFTHVAYYEELRVNQNPHKGNKFVLCHYPIISWNGMHHGTFMLHGHQHLKGTDRIGGNGRLDIGIDGNPNFSPYHIDEVVNICELQGKSII